MADLIERDLTIHELEAFKESRSANLLRMSFDDVIDVVNGIRAVDRWIPCAEQLPERETDVLVYIPVWEDNPIQVAYLMYDGIIWELSDGEFNFGKREVLYWMPLPEPPEVNEP